MVRNGLRELDAIFRVFHRFFERSLGDPDGHRTDADPAAIEDLQGVDESLALEPEERFHRNVAIRQDDLRGGPPADPQLVFDLPAGSPGTAPFHHESPD